MDKTTTPCIEWKGAVSKNGYGVFKVGGRTGSVVYVHRMAYRLHVGEIPDGMCVCHHCDNKICINHLHYFLGTLGDNVRDAWEKGRLKPPPTMHGEENPQSKLTRYEVRGIRNALATGEPGRSIARRYEVTASTVSAIKRRKIWSKT